MEIAYVSIILSISFPLLLLWLRKPRLSLSKEPETIDFPSYNAKIIRLRVINKPLITKLKLQGDIAHKCEVRVIRMVNLKTGQEVNFKYNRLKWTSGIEPLSLVPSQMSGRPSPVFDSTKINAAEVIDLPPGRIEEVDFCIKYQGDRECYIYNAWNYDSFLGKTRPWSNPINKIDEGIYRVEIEVTGCKPGIFVLRNEGITLDGFKLEKADC